ncbi:MAG: sigma-70 family RNA polymerase sigma factor [Acidobacteriota bacterium]
MPGEATGIGLMPQQLKVDDETPITRLIVRAQSGDTTAFDELMIAHERRVVAIAWRMLGNREEARDAAQETFLRVYRHLHGFDSGRDFSGWLYRIVVNVCRDQARKRGRLSLTNDKNEVSALAGDHDVEADAIRTQQRALVVRALATLSQKERAALVLRDLEGLATEEVARILGSSPTTVRSQISSARVKIKEFRDRWLQPGRKER